MKRASQLRLWRRRRPTTITHKAGISILSAPRISKAANVKGGSILLFHDYMSKKSHAIEALRILIPNLLAKGYEFVTVSEILSRDESSILMYRNCIADLQLHPDDIDEEYIRNTKALLISGTSLAASPSREAALKAVMLAKRNNTKIIFDVDYRSYSWKNMDEVSIYYSMVARDADIIMGSREEFNLMEALIEPGRTDRQTAEYWHRRSAKIVIIKHGKKGSTAYTCDGKHYTVRPFPVEALKSFGGGDGYGAGFLYGLYSGWDMYDCLEFGCAQASMMVAAHSCSEEMPTADAIHAFIKASKEKYGETVCCDREEVQ